jgi:uncharacterized protein YmfQ (DUF2313 family)
MARDPAFNTITRSGRERYAKVTMADPQDALSAPTNDDLISATLSFWPSGPAWGTPDGQAMSLTSNLARFTRVLISDFEWLYARAWRLMREASLQGVSELLPEWEKDYGVPEPCFADAEQSTAQRMAALERKVRAEGVTHPEDFVQLAADYGFEIEIEEPAIFECGFSECGGYHTTGSPLEETFWIVRIKDASITYFECGVSECGYDPLFSIGDAERIVCLLRQMAPAWTQVVLEPWITLSGLVTEDGTPIIDEYGNQLFVTL